MFQELLLERRLEPEVKTVQQLNVRLRWFLPVVDNDMDERWNLDEAFIEAPSLTTARPVEYAANGNSAAQASLTWFPRPVQSFGIVAAINKESR
jgi:hypothetical protein